MNVMLLSMSTFPKNNNLSWVLASCNDNEKYSYFSQLEPGCKQFIYALGDKENRERFDKIIVLCTPETKQVPDKAVMLNYSVKDEERSTADRTFFKTISSKEITARSSYDFFKDRLLNFIYGENDLKYEKELGIPNEILDKCCRFKNNGLYPTGNNFKENLFAAVDIGTSDEDIAKSIAKILSVIDEERQKIIYRKFRKSVYDELNNAASEEFDLTLNELVGSDMKIKDEYWGRIEKLHDDILKSKTLEDNEEIYLYLNAQGGFRTTVQIINSVMNMLKQRQYSLAGVNVVDYYPESVTCSINNVTNLYLINDLAAALNAFLEYGRADLFTKYYAKYNEIKNRTNCNYPEKNIISSMTNISNAILLSDADGFIGGIAALKEEIEKYETNESNKDPFFELIIKDIKDSYGELFDCDNIIHNLDILINWCINRKFIQQALTLLESKTPEFVFDYGFIYAKKNSYTLKTLKDLRDKTNIPVYKLKNPKYAVINTFCHVNGYLKQEMSKAKDKTEKDYFSALLDRKKKIGTNICNVPMDSKDPNEIQISLFSDYSDKALKITDKNNEIIDLSIGYFVDKYTDICRKRNDANHGGGNFSIKSIENIIIRFNKILTAIRENFGTGNPQKDFYICKNDNKFY